MWTFLFLGEPSSGVPLQMSWFQIHEALFIHSAAFQLFPPFQLIRWSKLPVKCGVFNFQPVSNCSSTLVHLNLTRRVAVFLCILQICSLIFVCTLAIFIHSPSVLLLQPSQSFSLLSNHSEVVNHSDRGLFMVSHWNHVRLRARKIYCPHSCDRV